MDKDKKKKGSILTILAIIVLACLVFFAGNDPLIDLTPSETPPEEISVPANVELYKFDDLSSNTSVNVELWLKNIGDETATDIEIFVRAKNQNGTILFSELVPTSVMLLEENETCSAAYSVPISEDDTNIYHTIEISWEDNRIIHSKITNLR